MDTKNKYSGLGGTWNLIKDTAETPEEIREVVETMDRSKEYELQRLKKTADKNEHSGARVHKARRI